MMLVNTAGNSPDLSRYLKRCYERASLLIGMKGDTEKAARYAVYAANIGRQLGAEE
jgi:hypothetical protein